MNAIVQLIVQEPDVSPVADVEYLNIRIDGPSPEVLFIGQTQVKPGIVGQTIIVDDARVHLVLQVANGLSVMVGQRVGEVA